MFYLLLFFSYSASDINISKTYADFIILNLEPFDYSIIHVGKGVSTILSDLNREDDIQIEVESINGKGNYVDHGIFNKYSHLYAIFFRNRNYKIKFTNEGQKDIELALVFSDEYFANTSMIREKISPRFNFNFPINQTRQLTKNFNYKGSPGNGFFLYLCFIVLLAVDVFVVVIFSCVCCSCC